MVRTLCFFFMVSPSCSVCCIISYYNMFFYKIHYKVPFKTALERILKAVKDAGKFTIIYCANFNIANARLKHGFDSVTVGQKQKGQRFHKIKNIEQK